MDVNDDEGRGPGGGRPEGADDVSPQDFGGMMRRARERQGISLRQIAIATKIASSALEALERNDVSRLPGGIFSRAFVRSYAVEVGLDPERTVREFIDCFPSEVAGHSTQHKRDFQQAEDLENRRQVVGVAVKLVGISVPVAALLVYFTFGNSGPARPPAGNEPAASRPAAVTAGEGTGSTGVTDAPTPAEAPQNEAPQNEAPGPVPQAESDLLRIAIRVTGPCWVSIVGDGRQSIGRVMNAGEQVVERVRNEIVLQVGDAGHFTFTINDTAGRALGSAGQVVTVRINRDNYQTFLQP